MGNKPKKEWESAYERDLQLLVAQLEDKVSLLQASRSRALAAAETYRRRVAYLEEQLAAAWRMAGRRKG